MYHILPSKGYNQALSSKFFQLAPPAPYHGLAAREERPVLVLLRHGGQGLPLVHFSSQPEPFLCNSVNETTQRIPLKVLTSRGRVSAPACGAVLGEDGLAHHLAVQAHVAHGLAALVLQRQAGGSLRTSTRTMFGA